MLPIFPIKLIMLLLPVVIASALLAVVGSRGVGVFKKQGVAWGLTALMVVAAIGIGYAKAPFNNPAPVPEPNRPAVPDAATGYVWDDAQVLSRDTVEKLNERNESLWEHYSVSIGVVTCNYGGDDLGGYALECAEQMGLGGYDFIVALDISGQNYWLIQGSDLRRDFTDRDCSDYAYEYMERDFARGDYDGAVLELTQALEDWYDGYYR